MANSQREIDIIAHCIEFMSNKEAILDLFNKKGLSTKKQSYKDLSAEFIKNPNSITVPEITDLFRSIWKSCNIQRHIQHLKSGNLLGHSWHGAMPSMLHLSIQDFVRQCSDGSISLSSYLNIGNDIIKHEYFMVATHDICESSIILSSNNVIPPIGNKSISDFIYNGIPYDLKVTTHPEEWKCKAGNLNIEEKKQLAEELYQGADSERMRKDAAKCKNYWGLNRMYFLVSDQDTWLNNPQGNIDFLLEEIKKDNNYFNINVNGFNIHICLIER